MNRININKKYLFRNFTAFLSVEFTVISAVLIFFSLNEDLGINLNTFCKKCLALLFPVALAALAAIIRTCTFRKNKIVDETQLSITLRYGNLWKFAFPNFSKKERIVVVNVNTAFDVITDSPNIHHPLVNARTIHGQWITQLKNRGIGPDEINNVIQENLESQGIEPTKIVQKDRGNTKNYPKGTIALFQYEKTTFYLLAMSEFDENNNAQNTQEELRQTILSLINYIGQYSQGCDVYIPVMGAGNSRTGIDDQSALDLLVSTLTLNKELLRGKINVVVYERNRDKVTIAT